MAQFITLTSVTGPKRRFNVNQIVTYSERGAGSSVICTDSDPDASPEWSVTEAPEQIDALLGVTASPAAETVAAALDAEADRLDDDATAIHNSSMRGDTKLRARAFRDAAKMARSIAKAEA